MRVQRVLLVGLCGLWVATAVIAGSKPVAVSPGDASKLVLIGDTCPTFSWGQVDGARGYELVVYRLGEDGEEARPVLRETFAGSVSGWTPSLSRCLERGGQYAWSVRAVSRRQPSDWSSPSLFEVAAGPSEVEFDAAVAVVRQYLEERGTAPGRGQDAERAGPPVGAIPSRMKGAAGRAAAETEAPTSALLGAAPAIPEAPATVSLVTEGALGIGTSTPLADLHVVGSPTLGGLLVAPDTTVNQSSELMLAEDDDGTFGMKIRYNGLLGVGPDQNRLEIWGHQSGADSGPWLTIMRDTGRIHAEKWNPDPPCFSDTDRFEDCSNGTVTDGVTGLIYLKDSDCLGPGTWSEAGLASAALAHGQCSLTDGSRAGDWRLQTQPEWQGILDPDCTSGPSLVGNGPAGTCYLASPWATGVAATGSYWSSWTVPSNPAKAGAANIFLGTFTLAGIEKSNDGAHVWPVRGGQ